MQTASQPPCERGRIRRAPRCSAGSRGGRGPRPDVGDKRGGAECPTGRHIDALSPGRAIALVKTQLDMVSMGSAPALTASSAGSLSPQRSQGPGASRGARTQLKSVPADAAVARLQRRPRPATRRASARAVCAASSRVGLTTRALTPGSPRRAARRARTTSGSKNARVLPDPARRAGALLGGCRDAGKMSTGQAPLPARADAGRAAR